MFRILVLEYSIQSTSQLCKLDTKSI